MLMNRQNHRHKHHRHKHESEEELTIEIEALRQRIHELKSTWPPPPETPCHNNGPLNSSGECICDTTNYIDVTPGCHKGQRCIKGRGDEYRNGHCEDYREANCNISYDCPDIYGIESICFNEECVGMCNPDISDESQCLKKGTCCSPVSASYSRMGGFCKKCEGTCSSNRECPNNDFCLDGKCMTPCKSGESNESQCLKGKCCKTGGSIAGYNGFCDDCEGSCKNNRDCLGNKLCYKEKCMTPCLPFPDNNKPGGQCPKGTYCKDEKYGDLGGLCEDYLGPCKNNDYCLDDNVCLDDGSCVGPNDDRVECSYKTDGMTPVKKCNQNSKNNICYNNNCVECIWENNIGVESSDCVDNIQRGYQPKENKYCNNNKCVECNTDHNCPDDKYCSNNKCENIPNASKSPGLCGMDGRVVRPCKDNNDCCSEYGYCGSGSTFCNENSLALAPGQCGQDGKFIRKCDGNGECCSQYGYCGTGPDFCNDNRLDPII